MAQVIPADFIERLIAERREKIDFAIERYFPRKVGRKEMEFICGPATFEYDITAVQGAVYEPGWNLLDRGGKRWRPLLMMLVIESLDKDPSDFLDFLVIPEVVHNGTLMVDDIEDGSLKRRGKPCIHRIPRYGVDIAINAGNTMYYVPLLSLIKNRNRLSDRIILDLYEIYSQEMINISHGQAMDIFWHKGRKDSVTVDQYLQMCAYKTGTLARMSAKIGATLADADFSLVNAFGRFAESIAVAFQIQDDILNLKKQLGKEFGEDIKEGKRSLLVIRALEKLSRKDSSRLVRILNMRTDNRRLIKEAIELIGKTDAFEFAENLATGLVRNSWKKLDDRLMPSKAKENLRMFANYLVSRKR